MTDRFPGRFGLHGPASALLELNGLCGDFARRDIEIKNRGAVAIAEAEPA